LAASLLSINGIQKLWGWGENDVREKVFHLQLSGSVGYILVTILATPALPWHCETLTLS